MEENSIEEAIERLEKGINDIWFSTIYSQEQEEKDLKILLSDYKRVLKENEELHKEINERIKLKIENEKIVDTQFLPIQKVKDKIEELKEQYNVRELDFIKTTQDIRKIIIQSLEELLEERKLKED